MAGTIKHRHQTALTDGGYDVDRNVWNDSLVIAGGSHGDLMQRDTGAGDGWSLVTPAYEPTITTLAVNKGGTGIASYAVGDLLYASGATTLSKLSDVAVGSVLVSGGVGAAPAWSANPAVTSLVTPLVTSTTNLVLNAAVNTIVQTANTSRWLFTNAWMGPITDASYDIGWSGARVQNAFFSTSVQIGTDTATGGDVRLGKAAGTIKKRNNANGADLNLIGGNITDTDDVIVGSSSGPFRWRSNLATPGSLADGDAWIDASGSSPSRVLALKARDGGVTRTIASVTY